MQPLRGVAAALTEKGAVHAFVCRLASFQLKLPVADIMVYFFAAVRPSLKVTPVVTCTEIKLFMHVWRQKEA